MPRAHSTMDRFKHLPMQRVRHHHRPPHLSGGGFLPGLLKHAIPQPQGLELSPQSLGDQ